jgi:hypothetical protein
MIERLPCANMRLTFFASGIVVVGALDGADESGGRGPCGCCKPADHPWR